MAAKIIEGFPISPRVDLMLKYAGIPLKVQKERPKRVRRARNKIVRLWEENKHLIYPKAIYQFFSYKIEDDRLALDDKGIFTSSYLVKNIRKSDPREVALFVVTIGQKFIEKIDEHLPAPATEQTLYLEAIGSEAVEAAARHLCQVLAEEKGYQHSFKRLSPGWGEQKGFDWKLAEQRITFNLLEPERIGAELIEQPEVESYMMIPRKTVSAIAFPVNS